MVLYVKLTNGDWRYCEWDDDEMLEAYLPFLGLIFIISNY